MKKKLFTLKSLMILGVFLCTLQLKAQDDVGELFKSGPADATKLANAYLSPFFKGFGAGLNSMWATSAKTKGFLRFDLRLSVAAAFVPEAGKTYDVTKLGLTNIRPAAGQSGIGATAFGSDKKGGLMEVFDPSLVIPPGGPTIINPTFNLPAGIGLNYVPSPQLQLTVGLLKYVDISLRIVPKIKISDEAGSINQFGLGTKIELIPLLMGKKAKILPLDLAIAGGFHQLTYNLPLNTNNVANSNQQIEAKINGLSAEAIISKKLAFFTPFASLGFSSSSSTIKALGTYEFDIPPTVLTPNGSKKTYIDPVNINNKDISGIRASVGFEMKLGFLKIYGAYTAAEYSFVNAGIGIGIGK